MQNWTVFQKLKWIDLIPVSVSCTTPVRRVLLQDTSYILTSEVAWHSLGVRVFLEARAKKG